MSPILPTLNSPLSISWSSIFKYIDKWTHLRLVCKTFKHELKKNLKTINFTNICFYYQLPEDFIIENLEYLPVYHIFKYQILSPMAIDNIWLNPASMTNKNVLCFYQDISFKKIDNYIASIESIDEKKDFVNSLLKHKTNIPTWFLEKYFSHVQLFNMKIYGPSNIDFIITHFNDINILLWPDIIKNVELPYDFLIRLLNIIDHIHVFNAKGVSFHLIKKYAKPDEWFNISLTHKLSLKMFNQYVIKHFLDSSSSSSSSVPTINTFPWKHFSIHATNLDNQVIDAYADYLDWEWICKTNKLEDWLMRRHFEKLIWSHIAKYQNLSHKFIIDFYDQLNPELMVVHQCLSDDIIINILHKNPTLFRNLISKHQTFNINFLQKHLSLLNPFIIFNRKDVPIEIKHFIRHVISTNPNSILKVK